VSKIIKLELMNKRFRTYIFGRIVELIVMNRERQISVIANSRFFAELDDMTRDVANRSLKSIAQNKSSRLCDVNVNKDRQKVFLIRANLFEGASKGVEVDQANNATGSNRAISLHEQSKFTVQRAQFVSKFGTLSDCDTPKNIRC
jgi:hypothetical protein